MLPRLKRLALVTVPTNWVQVLLLSMIAVLAVQFSRVIHAAIGVPRRYFLIESRQRFKLMAFDTEFNRWTCHCNSPQCEAIALPRHLLLLISSADSHLGPNACPVRSAERA